MFYFRLLFWKRGGKMKKLSWEFFFDIGIVAWVCLIFGLMVFLITTFEEHPLHIILGLICILYCVGRIHSVVDKSDIIKEIQARRNNDTAL
jgi:heme/copper-type cytochrome/quinol oxidase subunit 3